MRIVVLVPRLVSPCLWKLRLLAFGLIRLVVLFTWGLVLYVLGPVTTIQTTRKIQVKNALVAVLYIMHGHN